MSEIKEVLGDQEEVEDLGQLKYTDQVLEESLRKHPIAVGVPARVLGKEITVGGYQIPRRNVSNTNSLLLAMNPSIWKNPDVFDPKRFADPANVPNLSMIHSP